MTSDELAGAEANGDYIGDELELFSHATNWKRYFAAELKPYISGDVAEIGAGLGGTTVLLQNDQCRSWTCVEPDPALCEEIERRIGAGEVMQETGIVTGYLQDLPDDRLYDTIIYIDVLEHIEDDAGEVRAAMAKLREGGRLVVLSPAHQWLFSPFDAAIGHYRRYTRKTLSALTPADAETERSFYLDSVGMALSGANSLLLKQSQPKRSQIRFWDSVVVPVSRLVDAVTFRALGKTVIAVWRKTGDAGTPGA